MSELLKRLAYNKREPKFSAEVTELAQQAEYAAKMVLEGKLSQSEFQDFEAHIYSKYVEALPMSEYAAMRSDGRYEDLELLYRDNDRPSFETTKAREAISRKITHEALDDAWLSQKIDAKRYAEENLKLDPRARIEHDNYDGAASEFYAGRHGGDAPDPAGSTMSEYVASYVAGRQAPADAMSEYVASRQADAPPPAAE